MAEPNSTASDLRAAGRGRQPISRHPLFPAIVALWFATLLGVGSLMLRTSLVESVVVASHLDSLIPAAAPPLGTTARLLLAVLLGVPGGIVGWILAKRLGTPGKAGPKVFKVAESDLSEQPQWPGVAETPAPVDPAAEPAPALDPSSLGAEPMAEAPLPAAETIVDHQPIAAPVPHTAAQRIAAADLADLSHVELVERLAIALQRRRELLGPAEGEALDAGNPVLQFPDFADRRQARMALPAAQPRPVPQETEKALRAALAQLERMSGTA